MLHLSNNSQNYRHGLINTSLNTKRTTEEKKICNLVQEELTTQCVGRFCLDIPTSMHRWGESYKINNTLLQEKVFVPPFEADYERTWMAHLATIEALKKNQNYTDNRYGMILEKRALSPSLMSVFFYETLTRIVTLDALLNAGPLGLWLQVDGKPDRLDDMAEHVKELATAYCLPGKNGSLPTSGKNWFYMNRGAITNTFEYQEEASANFKDHPLNIELSISTATTNEPALGLIDRFKQTMMNAIAWKVGGISFLKKSTRKAAGLKGEEIILRDSNGGKLTFLWSFPGEPDSMSHPEITVIMNTPDEHLNEKTTFWDIVLNSIKSVDVLQEPSPSIP